MTSVPVGSTDMLSKFHDAICDTMQQVINRYNLEMSYHKRFAKKCTDIQVVSG